MSAVTLTIKPGVTIGAGVSVKVPVYVPPPPILKSLSFNGTQDTQLDILGATGDWALGQHGTIEWWQKGIDSTAGNGGVFVGGIISQGGGAGQNHGIDIFQANGMAVGLGGNTSQWLDPPAGVWSHIAVTISPAGGGGTARLFINGVEQTRITGYTDTNCVNGADILHIGCRIPGVNYQNWTGLINNLHINNTNLYTGTFTPTVRTVPITGTVLLLDSTNPLVDLSRYELNGVMESAHNGGTIYFSKSIYPDLDNQVRAGDTVVNVNNPTNISVVTGAVFTPNGDPDNWGINVSPGQLTFGAVNFSGPRHTTMGNVTVVEDAPT